MHLAQFEKSEASTYKTSPGSAMESAGGSCLKSPNGVHHWKYGKCNYCQKAEGKLVKGAGALANPGGAGGCSKDGGKCMFKWLAKRLETFWMLLYPLCILTTVGSMEHFSCHCCELGNCTILYLRYYIMQFDYAHSPLSCCIN